MTELSAEYASPGLAKRLEHEYALRGELDAAWAARPIALSRHDDRLTLVREDPGGEPLDRVLGGAPMAVTEFLRVAIPLTAALRRMHERSLIHKDIKPANILADVANGAAWLTGFGIASRLPRERQNPEAPEVIAGTLAYMAPEQTGRMNRSIDSRSDLYALGITFYEMLTGKLPFTAFEPMEWIHCHIARQPTPPGERVAGLPAPLEAIAMKLLAKTGEERYQTAAGVEADLRRCLAAWQSSGQIDPFPLGAQDASDKLMIPEQLYGREREIETLLAAFDRVVVNGATELVLVSGYAGIGKSSVVNELHKVLVPPRGWFAAGKFDQYKRDIPYATLAQAFQSLVRELLSKSDAEVSPWRAELLEALGPNGELMVNLIPELAHLIGAPPPLPALPPQDAQNRFQLVFRRFLGVFARPEHPLALFVDDLQWLDTATLDLLEHLVTHPEVRHLLLVGAYRDNEVGPAHPLVRTLEVIRRAGGRVHETVLAPLLPDSVEQLVADSFHCDRDTAQPLAQLVHEKTAGNPFFAIQFLTALNEEALIAFEHNSARWTWDLPRIRAKGFTANVADLMANKLSRLPVPTREALGQLACLGNVAEVATLSLVHGASADTLHAALWEAVRAGLVFRADGGAYAFVHDRVQEAAYALIPDGERSAAHLRIGRALASRTAPEQLEETIFDIVNHLNRGAALLTEPAERERVLDLNLMAGHRARNSTAYASARNYLAQAAKLLSPDDWRRRYGQTFDLYLAFSECEYLVGRFPAADALFDLLLEQARTNLDRAKVYSLRMKLYQVAGKYDDGFAAALEALRDFAVTLPESTQDIQEALAAELRDIPLNLGGRPISALLDAPAAADPATRAIIDLLVEAMPCAYIGRPLLFPLITLKAVNLSLRHGHTDQSSYVYGNYAVMLVSLGEIAAGVEFSEMSLRLNEKFNNPRLRGKLLHLHGDHINFWRAHLATGLPILEQAIRACLEVGDHVFAGYLAFETLWQVIETGAALEEVQALSVQYAAFAGQSHNDAVCETIRLQQRFAASLQGKTAATLSFADHVGFNEAACFATLVKANFGCGIVFYYIMKQMLAFLGGRHAEALDFAQQAQTVLGAAMGMPIEATFHYFHALTLAALYPAVGLERQQEYREILAGKLEKFALWARHSPENYRNRHALVAAEIAGIEGRDTEAMRFYEAAIHSSRESGFLHNQGIAHELAARFYAARGFETIADTYLRNARHCYLGWGAAGKVRQLEHTYPRLREAPAHLLPSTTIETPQEQLDLATFLKTSLAVSGEIVPDRLIETLMTIAVEHAGAERGLLVRPYGHEQRIEAEATTGREQVLVRLLGTQATPAELPASVLHYVVRTQESVILDDAAVQNRFSSDEYLRHRRVRSLLCLPLVKQTKLIGVLYLENNLASGAFTPARITMLKLLSSQAAISLENARLYADLVQESRDRTKAEEALRSTQADLARVARLTTMGELVASIAHEINQPLAAVVTSGTACLRWLDRAEPDIDAARKSVLRIVRDAGRAGEVIHGLRSLAKKSGPQLMRLDLNDAIQEVLALTRSELQARGVALHTTLSSADRPVVGDRVQLQQVLLNLILNGVEAMSVITDRPKVLAITSEPVEPGGVLVAVEDTGPGLDPATADRIFDPFFTTKPDGMGMGLSICRSIIDAHGGRFWAAPRKPWGTVFRFTVPRESSAA